FSGIENLTGGTNTDTFKFHGTAGVTGAIDGGVGGVPNVLDYSFYTTGITVNLATNTATGVGTTFSNIQSLVGSHLNDVLIGANTVNTWNITTNNGGNISGAFIFTGIENLTGGTNNDTFKFSNGTRIAGYIDGGGLPGNNDTLDWSSYTTARS